MTLSTTRSQAAKRPTAAEIVDHERSLRELQKERAAVGLHTDAMFELHTLGSSTFNRRHLWLPAGAVARVDDRKVAQAFARLLPHSRVRALFPQLVRGPLMGRPVPRLGIAFYIFTDAPPATVEAKRKFVALERAARKGKKR